MRIPDNFPVRPLKPGEPAKDRATCGACGRSWDDGISTEYTPAPAGRCPFEAFHKAQREAPGTRASQRGRDVQFFKAHAGYSIAPGETREQGRLRSARALADAEARGRDAGLSFEWSIDPDSDSSDWSDERPAWQVWQCVAYDESGNAVASLGAVDFGRDGSPHADRYRRVVEAELALEALNAAKGG